MFKDLKEYLPVSLISFLYSLLLTWNIPFFWMDYINITILSRQWNYQLLNTGFEFYFRPFENAVYYVFLHLFGIEALPLRIFKALMTAGVVCFIYYFVKKNTNSNKTVFLASLFFLITSTVLQSVMLIYDFEIVAQFFMLGALYFFFKIYDSNVFSWKNSFFFLTLVYLAFLTKESSKIFVGILFIFIILQGVVYHTWKKTLLVLISFLLILSIKPGMLIGLQHPSSASLVNYLISWFDYNNLILFFQYFIMSTFSILILILYIFFRRRKEKERNENTKAMLFFGLWFAVNALLTSIIPMNDLRYALVPFLPFVIFSAIYIGRNLHYLFSSTKYIAFFFIIVLVLNFAFNSGMSLKYRYGFGNFFIVLDESHEFTNVFYLNKTFVYADNIAHDSWSIKGNQYIQYSQAALLNHSSLFFFALYNPLQTKEKETAQLIKMFQKGPHCFMLYKQENQTITSAPVIASSKNTFAYIFPHETALEYCSIEINTRFLLPQKVILTLVGDTENATVVLSPPVGKYKSCEYQCPAFNNNKTKIKAIEVRGHNSFLTKIYNGTVHYIEKI